MIMTYTWSSVANSAMHFWCRNDNDIHVVERGQCSDAFLVSKKRAT